MILLWDNLDEDDGLVILSDDGEFYFYGEDSVAIAQDAPDDQSRYFCKLNKMQDITPLNNFERHEILDPRTGVWTPLANADDELIKMLHREALDPDWNDVP